MLTRNGTEQLVTASEPRIPRAGAAGRFHLRFACRQRRRRRSGLPAGCRHVARRRFGLERALLCWRPDGHRRHQARASDPSRQASRVRRHESDARRRRRRIRSSPTATPSSCLRATRSISPRSSARSYRLASCSRAERSSRDRSAAIREAAGPRYLVYRENVAYRRLRRAFDIAFALLALVATAPLLRARGARHQARRRRSGLLHAAPRRPLRATVHALQTAHDETRAMRRCALADRQRRRAPDPRRRVLAQNVDRRVAAVLQRPRAERCPSSVRAPNSRFTYANTSRHGSSCGISSSPGSRVFGRFAAVHKFRCTCPLRRLTTSSTSSERRR